MLSMLMTTEYAPAEDRHKLQQLLIHIAGGEREALAELYQRTRAAVYGLALSYLKNAHDAQDLTQDVYVQVWDCAEQYRLTGSPMGWLLAVCRNLCPMRRSSSVRLANAPCSSARSSASSPHSRAGMASHSSSLRAAWRSSRRRRIRHRFRHTASSQPIGDPVSRYCCKAHWQASLTRSGASCCSTLLRA